MMTYVLGSIAFIVIALLANGVHYDIEIWWRERHSDPLDH